MGYEKRLCVLKQIKNGFSADGGLLTGAVYAERTGGELIVTPKIAGLSALSEGRYALAVLVGDKRYCFEWKGNAPIRVPDAPSLEKGFAALVAFVKGEAEPIAYGYCGGAPSDCKTLLSLFSEKEREGRTRPIPTPMPPNQIPGAPSPQVPLAPAIPVPETEDDEPFRDVAAGYDDDAIAATNYFRAGVENADSAPAGAEKEDGEAPCQNADDSAPLFRLSRGGLTYYRSVAAKLKEAFAKFPRDETLLGVFPHSEWVRTDQALLGVVYAEGEPRYLCVAMENEPPEEVGDAAIFVPVSCFSDEKGVYVVFQDADTGEYVKVENA